MTEIVAIHRLERLAMTDTGDICPIETFLDDEGEEVDDSAIAVVAIGPLPDGRWFSVDMRDFAPTEAQ